MPSQYTKPTKTYAQLVSLLQNDRGMKGCPQELEKRIRDVGYYRLSAYWRPFTSYFGNNEVINTSIDEVWNIYCFDRQLRLVLLDGIERIEIALRNHIIDEFCHQFGEFEYANGCNFNHKDWGVWIGKQISSFTRSKTDSAVNYRKKYGNGTPLPPLWILVETMDFGSMSKFYAMLPAKIKKNIAKSYDFKSYAILESWLTSLNSIRNACAHHQRVWNKTWVNKPELPITQDWYLQFENQTQKWVNRNSSNPSFPIEKTFITIVMCRYFLRIVASTSSWHKRIEELLDDQRFSTVNTSWMGIPAHWKEHPLWK